MDKMILAAEQIPSVTRIPNNAEQIRAEQSLLERAANRDTDAFAEIYELHHTAIGNYIFRRTLDSHVTEDLLGDVFLAVLERFSRFKMRGVPVRVWLYRIANNLVNLWIRKHQREQRRLAARAEIERSEVQDEDIDRIEPTEVVRMVQMLAPKYQEVVALYYFESMSVTDVAGVLKIKEGTVKSRLGRARQALQKIVPNFQ